MAVSDFLALEPLPAEMKNDPTLFAGCVAGAIEVPEMENELT
jgi:arsenite methyltransferase